MSTDWQALRRAVARRLLRPRAATVTPISAAEVRHVLLARPNHRLGNVLLLTPLLQELETLLPQATVDVLAGPPFAAELLQGYAAIRRVDTLSARPLHQPAALWMLWRALPRRGYTLALDAAERSQSARWAVQRSGARWRVGMSDTTDDLHGLTQAVPYARCGVHQAQMPVRMLRIALGLSADAPLPPLRVRLRDDELHTGAARVTHWLGAPDARAPRIGLFAEATGTKRYPPTFWQALIAALHAQCPQARLGEIVPAHGRPLLPQLPGLHTPALRAAAAVCAACDLVIAADSGLMHLAAASGVPLLSLFQATDAARYGPYGARQQALDTRNAAGAEAIAAQALALMRATAD